MSYHVQQNSPKKTLGIFFVIAFHIVLIWGFANGLGKTIGTIIPDSVKTKVLPEKIIPIPPPKTIDPTFKQINLTDSFVLPKTDITFESTQEGISTTFSQEQVVVSTLTKPQLKKASKPDYPAAAARSGVEGATTMNLLVNINGRVTDAKLVSTSGSDQLDDAALKHALHNWAFTACTEGGQPVACWFKAKLVWRIEDAKR